MSRKALPAVRRFTRILVFISCVFISYGTAWAGSFLAFPAKTYVRQTGKPVTVTDTFTVRNPNTQYTLHLANGGLQDDVNEYVSSTVITVNGVTVVAPSDLNQNVARLDRAVQLSGTNTISVQLRGKPGGMIAVEIFGVDNDPPVITATPSPVANAAGWNNSSVTVSFTCSDTTSGVAVCPSAVTIATEGARQVISGTATDAAGNNASASITLNIDETNPTITSAASPAPNGNGWNNSPVTVSFNCADALSGIASCAVPVTVSTEGRNQAVSGLATDKAGNSASASQTVSIDITPPMLVISTPSGTTVSAPGFAITGTVTDALSGVNAGSVTCGGQAAVLSGTNFTCNVTLARGLNDLLIQASDVAGNSITTHLQATLNSVPPGAPAFIAITPDNMSLLISDTQLLIAVDDHGVPITGAVWSIDDPSIASVSSDVQPPVLTAKAPGNTKLRVSFEGRNAEAQIAVFAGDTLPPGTIRWSLKPVNAQATIEMLQAVPTANDTPAFFSVESPGDGSALIRALRADGRQMWSQTLGGVPPVQASLDRSLLEIPRFAFAEYSPTAAFLYAGPVLIFSQVLNKVPDQMGGLVALIEDEDSQGIFTERIVKLDGMTGAIVWHYDLLPAQLTFPPGATVTGTEARTDGNFAQSPDGTIYLTVQTIGGGFDMFFDGIRRGEGHLAAIDGNTGIEKFRVELPNSVNHAIFQHVALGDDVDASAAGPIAVMPDRSAQVVVGVNTVSTESECVIGSPCITSISQHNSLQLVRIQPDGTPNTQILKTFDYDAANCVGKCPEPTPSSYSPAEVIPDGAGGELAGWTLNTVINSTASSQTRITHLGPDRTILGELAIPFTPRGALQLNTLVVGENGTAFATNGSQILSFDINSGNTNWSFDPPHLANEVQIVAAAAGGGLVAKIGPFGGAQQVARFDALGTQVFDQWVNGQSALNYLGGDQWGGIKQTPSVNAAVTASSPSQAGPIVNLAELIAAPGISLALTNWATAGGESRASDPALKLVGESDFINLQSGNREIIYRLRKADGTSPDNGLLYNVNEFQTDLSVAKPNGISVDTNGNQFHDVLQGPSSIQSPMSDSKQTFGYFLPIENAKHYLVRRIERTIAIDTTTDKICQLRIPVLVLHSEFKKQTLVGGLVQPGEIQRVFLSPYMGHGEGPNQAPSCP